MKEKYVKPWVEVVKVDYGVTATNDNETGQGEQGELIVPLGSASSGDDTTFE